MQATTFLDPGAVVLIYHMGFRIEKGLRILLPRSETCGKYLDTHNEWIRKKRISSTSMPIRTIEKYSDLIESLAEWRRLLIKHGGVHELLARRLSIQMSEILSNAFVHGRSKNPCIIAGQAFPRSGHITVVAADFGLTIPGTLRASGRFETQRMNSDGTWIEFALQKGVTCKTTEDNYGMGLAALSKEVARERGKLIILSQSGILLQDGERIVPNDLNPARYDTFPGTFISLDFPTDNHEDHAPHQS